MTALREGLPEGRYGRSADAQADRRLKQVGIGLGAVVLVLVGWYGWYQLSATTVSAEVITFQTVSDQAVQAHIQVHKDAGVIGVCTLRSQAADSTEVGRRDVRFTQRKSVIDTVVTIRTTARGTTAELLGCHAAGKL
jgi:hypothetical protein